MVLKYSIVSKSKFICQHQILSRLIILSHVRIHTGYCYLQKDTRNKNGRLQETWLWLRSPRKAFDSKVDTVRAIRYCIGSWDD